MEQTGSNECVQCGESFTAELPVCCANASYDDGTHDDGFCKNCCGPHFAPRLSPTYERMDCDA